MPSREVKDDISAETSPARRSFIETPSGEITRLAFRRVSTRHGGIGARRESDNTSTACEFL